LIHFSVDNNKYSSREAQEFFQLFNETTGLAPFIHSKVSSYWLLYYC